MNTRFRQVQRSGHRSVPRKTPTAHPSREPSASCCSPVCILWTTLPLCNSCTVTPALNLGVPHHGLYWMSGRECMTRFSHCCCHRQCVRFWAEILSLQEWKSEILISFYSDDCLALLEIDFNIRSFNYSSQHTQVIFWQKAAHEL